jgi:hypothetical protein
MKNIGLLLAENTKLEEKKYDLEKFPFHTITFFSENSIVSFLSPKLLPISHSK